MIKKRCQKIAFVLAMLISLPCYGESEGDTASPPERNVQGWEPQMESIRQQLDLIKLFCVATAVGGMSVDLPKMAQAIPAENIQELAKANIQLDLKSIKLADLQLSYDTTPKWQEERPAIPSLLQFSRVTASVEAKTPLGKFPVKCSFKNGVLPLNFECKERGYDIRVIPESRKAEAKIEEVSFDLGGPLANHVMSKLFGRKVAESVLQFGMGQTLKLDKGSLLGDKAVSSVLERVLR
ncbi:MAG TPA: hypothetical protein PLI09_15085 [Candidatus Hydrogenedentes bacterium]|nr:hypothetical protein [Candidatus Hydrogenedentota bacterium]